VAAATTASVKDSLFLDVRISDKYGNLAFNPGPSNLQVGLVATGGLLTATQVYIPASCSDTSGTTSSCAAPFGPIQWTMPTTYPGTVTLTATGVISGVTISNSTTLTLVDPHPTFSLTSPKAGVNGAIYSNSPSVVIKGDANASLGYDSDSTSTAYVPISQVSYKIDSGSIQTAIISSSSAVTFSVAAIFTNGLHTISFNTTDSLGNEFVGTSTNGGTLQVLVDTTAPTVTFVTKANAGVNASMPLTFNVVVAEGDLGVPTVAYNGTALSSTLISVTPAVNITSTLGKSTTYTVTAKLPSGKWLVTIGATDLAGKSATTAQEMVTAILPTDQSFTATGVSQSTFAGEPAVVATLTNNLPTAYSAIVYATISGSGVIPTATISNLAPGASTQIYLALAGLAPGTYTVTFTVYSTLSVPLSVPYTTSVTIS